MELVFERLNTQHSLATDLTRKTFKQAGGVIGRGQDCDWIISDRKRHLSNHHASVSYRDGRFFLTDVSSNGTLNLASGVRLLKGEAVPIEDGSAYALGDVRIRARLVGDPAPFDIDVGLPRKAGSVIPDNAFLDLDPLHALDQQERACSLIDELNDPGVTFEDTPQRADYAPIERENLTVPELVNAPQRQAPAALPIEPDYQEGFWNRFGSALGMNIEGLDQIACETLALNTARLLRQSLDGLQQSLHTRSELKNELRLARTTAQGCQMNPLKFTADAGEALEFLLRPSKPGQLCAEQAIAHAFRDVQAHQVALLSASRAALRGALEHFSPQQMTLRFERDNKPLFATLGSRWRAYERYHQGLQQDNDWSERLLARDFAQAYEEQVRLISSLHFDQG